VSGCRTPTTTSAPPSPSSWRRVVQPGDVEEGQLVVSASYGSFDDLWPPLGSGVGPAGAHVVSLDAEPRRALAAGLRRRLGEPDGPFLLSARAWYATGTS
jgi:hypothetical protein